jgi:hypothetical protein
MLLEQMPNQKYCLNTKKNSLVQLLWLLVLLLSLLFVVAVAVATCNKVNVLAALRRCAE